MILQNIREDLEASRKFEPAPTVLPVYVESVSVSSVEDLESSRVSIDFEKIKKVLDDNLERSKREMEERMKAQLELETLKWRLKESESSPVAVVNESIVSEEVNESIYLAIGKRIRLELQEEANLIMEKRALAVKELEELQLKVIEQAVPSKSESLKKEISEIKEYRKVLDEDLVKIEELKIEHATLLVCTLLLILLGYINRYRLFKLVSVRWGNPISAVQVYLNNAL